MVSELKILLPKEMAAKSTTKVRKSEYDLVVCHQLHKFEDNKVPLEERQRIVWFLGEWHAKKMCKKKG